MTAEATVIETATVVRSPKEKKKREGPGFFTKIGAGFSAFGGATKAAAARTHLGALGLFNSRYERAQTKYTNPGLFQHQGIREQCLKLVKKMLKVGPGHKKAMKLLLHSKRAIFALEQSMPENINQYEEGLTQEVRLGLSRQIQRLEKDLEPAISKILYEELGKLFKTEETD